MRVKRSLIGATRAASIVSTAICLGYSTMTKDVASVW